MPQVIIIKRNNKTVYVGSLCEIKQTEYEKLVSECEKNYADEQKEKRELKEKIANLELKLKEVKHEIAVDRGEEE